MGHAKGAGTREVLRAKESELLSILRNREGLEAQAEPDYFDQIQAAAARALVVHSLDRHWTLLHEVRAALGRLSEGSYGQCLQCGETISPKRLAAVPWAGLCLPCQQEADFQEPDHAGELEFSARR